jgi:type IV pilus assembly protein PilX
MLTSLLALWGSRTSLYNEIIVGNDADYQRAFEAAQALIQDAEFDIRGERSDGSACSPESTNAKICRVFNPTVNPVWIPTEDKETGDLLAQLDNTTAKCLNGICLKRVGAQDFWNDKTSITAMMQNGVGARYGEFTGAKSGSASNPILKLNQSTDDVTRGGWYWIEIMPYDPNAGNSGLITNAEQLLPLNLVPNIAYRITAVAHGLKRNTRVVLQSTYVRQKVKN